MKRAELNAGGGVLPRPCTARKELNHDDREEIGFLVYTNLAAARTLGGLPDDASAETVVSHPTVIAHVRVGFAKMKAAVGRSADQATRAPLITEPPSIDASEITDKGYINQRASLTRRVALVEKFLLDLPRGYHDLRGVRANAANQA